MLENIRNFIQEQNYTITEELHIDGRVARYREIPKYLFDSRVGLAIHSHYKDVGGLWHHQSLALEKSKDSNVVVSTGTASGKSLIFGSYAFHQYLLDKDSRTLIFYPLKALVADQYEGWLQQAKELELEKSIIGRIDGSVHMSERDEILGKARIVIMTPDVCHAWLMSNLANPVCKEFVRNLKLIVLDEANTLEGVFGSNFSFLFRRIQAARNSLIAAKERRHDIKVIAATATISNPSEHLNMLTGMEFESIGEDEDGSPQFERTCFHIASPLGDEMTIARKLQINFLESVQEGGMITFVDSRKGVEMLAVASNRELKEIMPHQEVLPYRAGIDSEDRKNIEKRLRKGSLRGVVSTSALELGIDIPHLVIGMNVSVPPTRKSYRQRLGRIGRGSKGVFIIIAEQNAFSKYGTTFQQYHDLSVEPSYLYLDNRFMQFAHAKCLIDELDSIGANEKSTVPTRISWPDGFDEIFQTVLPGSNRPREFDAIAQLGGDIPQRGYPMRNIGEFNFKIGFGENAKTMGDASLPQALRKCYPGATYWHLAKPYKVLRWYTNSFQQLIKIKAVPGAQNTKPRIRTWISAGITRQDIVDHNFMSSDDGFICECNMQITEKVEGYQEGDGPYRSYTELREKNQNMRPQTRQFRTTGIIISINQDWFSEKGMKLFLEEKLSEIFIREYSVLPQDIGSSSTNISITSSEGHFKKADCIVVFDQAYGSLRLTERIYTEIHKMLERMAVAADTEEGEERTQYKNIVKKMEEFYSSLKQNVDNQEQLTEPPNAFGIMQVYAPGSIVALREKGQLFIDVEVVTPTIMDGGLMYQVKCFPKHPGATPTKRWVNSSYLESTAVEGEWSYQYWDSESEEYVDSGIEE